MVFWNCVLSFSDCKAVLFKKSVFYTEILKLSFYCSQRCRVKIISHGVMTDFLIFFFFRLLFLLYIYVCVYIQREREHIWYIKYILYIQIDINSNIWGIYSYLHPSLDVFSLALMNKSYFPATWMQKHCKAHFGFYCIILKEKIKFIIFNCESACLYIIFYQHSIWELKF